MNTDSISAQRVGPFMVWQLALFATVVHHACMKVPKQPDTALAIIPSIVVGNSACITALLLKSAPLCEWAVLLGHFNAVFVKRSRCTTINPLDRSYYPIRYYPQCLLQTSWGSRAFLVHGNRLDLRNQSFQSFGSSQASENA